MAKRSKNNNVSVGNGIKKIPRNADVISIFSAKITLIGKSGKQYVWKNAGQVVPVLLEDLDTILSSHIGSNSLVKLKE